jgi:hypothetical protein
MRRDGGTTAHNPKVVRAKIIGYDRGRAVPVTASATIPTFDEEPPRRLLDRLLRALHEQTQKGRPGQAPGQEAPNQAAGKGGLNFEQRRRRRHPAL